MIAFELIQEEPFGGYTILTTNFYPQPAPSPALHSFTRPRPAPLLAPGPRPSIRPRPAPSPAPGPRLFTPPLLRRAGIYAGTLLLPRPAHSSPAPRAARPRPAPSPSAPGPHVPFRVGGSETRTLVMFPHGASGPGYAERIPNRSIAARAQRCSCKLLFISVLLKDSIDF